MDALLGDYGRMHYEGAGGSGSRGQLVGCWLSQPEEMEAGSGHTGTNILSVYIKERPPRL